MNRRKLCLASIAALAASLFGVSRAQAAKPAGLLEQTRDILLPGLWSIARRYRLQYEITVDRQADCLIVMAWQRGRVPLAFAITRPSIVDRTAIVEFGPNCETLCSRVVAA